MLSDRDITRAALRGQIALSPVPEPDRVQPVSVDVTLGPTLRTFAGQAGRTVRLGEIPDDLTTEVEIPAEGYRLAPGEFVLASTAEAIGLAGDVAARLEGKSTLGRLGLLVHATAGLIDPGFLGHITLEVANVGVLGLVLVPGERIGQLTFEFTSSPCLRPYGSPGLGSHYQGQIGPTGPRTAVVADVDGAEVVAVAG